MQAFIVRPFGTKKIVRKNADGTVRDLVEFNFDRVEQELIAPALKVVELEGGTTGKIFAAGEIREDMFSLLLMARVIIADISVHNANVFYELGIRNALRDKSTILIKCPGFDDTPFDIIGYRYVSYDKDNPGAAVDELAKAISESLESSKKDSPVFNMLPKLEAQNPEKFLAVPPDFTEELQLALAAKDRGKLALLAEEVKAFDWSLPALRLVGEALFKVKADDAGREAWEKIMEQCPADTQAADRLANIYQRLAEAQLQKNHAEAEKLLSLSDTAIDLLLGDSQSLRSDKRAEALALKGRNAKARWNSSWMDAAEGERAATALQSSYWQDSLSYYEQGYHTNLNHYYSGINAFGLLTTILCLAAAQPGVWSSLFADDDEAAAELAKLKKKSERLSAALRYTIDAEKGRLKALDQSDLWLDITAADYLCLTASDAARITSAYKPLLSRCSEQQRNSIIRQLLLYRALGVTPASIDAAIQACGAATADKSVYHLLFTGHMIDAPDRPQPRFPPEKEAAARAAIRERIGRVMQAHPERDIVGIAGGASGGDILFHELCTELGIKSELYLALPRPEFLNASVSPAGNRWIDRFDQLYGSDKIPVHGLAETEDPPGWLKKRPHFSLWERNNLWMLYNATADGGLNMSLIALWDGQGGDGPGGTEHLVKETRRLGGRVEIIDITTLA